MVGGMTSEEQVTVISCVCAWCKTVLGVVQSAWIGVEATETHGICEACHARLDEIAARERKQRSVC